ncbi:MAG: LysR family transcriptional regulator [Alphaproteobacteria bacterium]|nr:LysR family transcriptional regulator [Alphaproteobacteria bacterium]
MDWDDLRYVLAVARAGTLSGAAGALGVSHPTVFRRVDRIEDRLGVRLFERARDGYGLTPEGEEMAALAGRMAEDVAELERRLAGRDLRPSGTVRVTTTDTLLIGFLSPVLAAFRSAHPEIRLEVLVSNAMFNLTKRDADVAIRPSRTPPETLVGRRVADLAWAVYARKTRAGTSTNRPALAERDWVGPDDSLAYLPMAQWLAEQGLDRRVVYRANTVLGLYDAVRAGLGVAALPCYMGDADRALMRIAPPIAALDSELWLLTHADLRKVARIRAFLDFMAGRLKALRPRLAGEIS